MSYSYGFMDNVEVLNESQRLFANEVAPKLTPRV